MREVYHSEVARKKEEQEKENQAKVSHREAVQSKLQGAVDALKELSRQQELGNRNLTSALMLLVPLSVAQEDTEAKMKMFDEYNKRLAVDVSLALVYGSRFVRARILLIYSLIIHLLSHHVFN